MAVYETICLDLSEDLVNRFFASVAEISLEKGKLRVFQPQHLSNTVWAYATLGLLHFRFIETVAEEVKRIVALPFSNTKSGSIINDRGSFKPQEVSNL